MPDQYWRPGNMLYPLPVVMVSCGDEPSNYNIVTVAWAGTVCSDPVMVSISLRKSRHSHAIISRTREFVINLTTESLAFATDWCGVRSGRDYDKWGMMNLTPLQSRTVAAPSIAQSPVSLECKVQNVLELGSHDMFVAEVSSVRVDDRYLDPRTSAFDLASARPLCYCHGVYYSLGREVGRFGFSVKKGIRKS